MPKLHERNMFQRGNMWYSRIRVGGKLVRKKLSTDKRIARSIVRQMETQRDAGRFGLPVPDTPWKDFKEKYFEWANANKAPSTVCTELRAIRYLTEFCSIKKLSDVSPSKLEDLRTKMRNAGKSIIEINRDVRAIKTIMRKAENNKIIQPQNWASVGKYKEPKGKLLFYTKEELKRLTKTCRGPWLTICLLGARAGLRRGEIHSLTWDDVDFERNRLHIAPKEDWAPKDYERRHVPISADLLRYLKLIKKSSQSNYVVSNGKKRETVGSLTTYFRRLSRKAGLKGNIHTLRHTFASHLAMAGVSLYTIGKLLGHSKITTTEIYAHLSPDTYSEAISKLPAL